MELTLTKTTYIKSRCFLILRTQKGLNMTRHLHSTLCLFCPLAPFSVNMPQPGRFHFRCWQNFWQQIFCLFDSKENRYREMKEEHNLEKKFMIVSSNFLMEIIYFS